MNYISLDSPCYYLTAVAKDRLPVFRTDAIKSITCKAIDEARSSGKFLIFAYVIMPDHIHTITGDGPKPSVIQRFINGIVAHRIIEFLKHEGHDESLRKLSHDEQSKKYKYSLWDHHPNARALTTESMFMQRVHYTHQNPVRAGLVATAEEYRWSSIRYWNRYPIEDEPLLMDNDQIKWRS
jgi:REP element-mobilizing transposase RayT